MLIANLYSNKIPSSFPKLHIDIFFNKIFYFLSVFISHICINTLHFLFQTIIYWHKKKKLGLSRFIRNCGIFGSLFFCFQFIQYKAFLVHHFFVISLLKMWHFRFTIFLLSVYPKCVISSSQGFTTRNKLPV